MAQLIIDTSTDGDAVWLWELCKKLGFGVETVRFGDCNVTGVDSDVILLEEAKAFFRKPPKQSLFSSKGTGKSWHRRKKSNRILKKSRKL